MIDDTCIGPASDDIDCQIVRYQEQPLVFRVEGVLKGRPLETVYEYLTVADLAVAKTQKGLLRYLRARQPQVAYWHLAKLEIV